MISPPHYGRGRISLAAILVVTSLQLATASLSPGLVDGLLTVEARDLDFVTGRALERLRDGGSVTYVFRLSVSGERRGPAERSREYRFVWSYDLWEERFAVAQPGSPTRSVSNLSSAEAQVWTLNNLSLPVGQMDGNRPFWLRLEYRAEIEDLALEDDENDLFGLGELVNIFSRPAADEVPEGVLEAGPFLLSDLR